MFHFYTPWKHQKTSGFSDVFRRYGSGVMVENGLNTIIVLWSTMNATQPHRKKEV